MAGRYSAAGSGPAAEVGGSGPSAGDVVAGVRLEDLVGEGAAGRVWAGTDLGTGERVAVKLLRSSGAEREAALLAALRHPHVLALHRVSSDPPAVVTELARGGSLSAQVSARGSLRPGEVVTVVAPLAGALELLHRQGVVHGDVTAGNVLFVDRGRPVLADLGGAVLAGAGRAVATEGFVAPEVLAGGPPSPAADVHGLAGCAWLALTGQLPPPAQDRLPLRLLVPDCPDELLSAVTAGLDPDPAARPTPGALAAAARASCRSEPVGLVPSAALGVRAEEAVTFQVRAAAREASPAPGPGRRLLPGLLRRRGAEPGRPGTSSTAARHATGGARPGVRPLRPGGWADRLRGVPVRPAAVVLAVAVTGVAGVALVLVPPGPPPGDGSPAAAPATTVGPKYLTEAWSTAPVTPVLPTHPPTGPADGADPPAADPTTADPTTADPTLLTPRALEQRVVGLVAARGRALRAGDEEALALVHHPLGSTLAADTALLAAGPLDVSYRVLEVLPSDEDPGSARVTLRTEVAGAPAVTERVTVVLARHDGRWRVHDVSL